MEENIVAKGFGRGYAYSFRMDMIYRDLKAAGGVAYEIMQQSGLIEFRQQKILWNDIGEKLRENDIDGVHYGVALEVYVKHKERDSLDHIYLCGADLGQYQLLLELGAIQAGMLVINYSCLSKIAQLGFHCILPLSDSEEIIEDELYESVFGKHMMQFVVKPWRTQKLAKSGFNLVLFNPVTMIERIETRLDMYALETAMKVLGQEAKIREYIDPEFYVERIEFGPWDDDGIPFPFWDNEVLNLMKDETPGIFLREAGLKVEDFPLCYRKLAYQTAYIKHYYPQLNHIATETSKGRGCGTESMGIELDVDVSRGAYCYDKEIRLVQRLIRRKVDYEGFNSVYNAGLVVSEMGLLLRKIKKRAEMFVGDRRYVTICLPTEIVSKESMIKKVDRFRKRNDNDEIKEFDLQIYDELEISDCGTVELVEKAAELAGIENVSMVPRALSIVAAYEHRKKAYRLAGCEYGVVFDWNYNYFCISIVSRQNQKDVMILNQKIIRLPLGSLDSKKDLNHNFLKRLQNKMYLALNKDGSLTYLNTISEKQKLWDEFYDSSNRVIKQVMRCGYATLIFDEGGEHQRVERYSERAFLDLLYPYYVKIESEIQKLLEESQVSAEDISKIYVAGEWGNYPYIWERLEIIFPCQKKICLMADTTYAAVKGAAYLAKDME